MSVKLTDPLLAIGKAIVILFQIFTALAGAALVIGLPFVIFLRDKIGAEMAAESGITDFAFPTVAVVGVLLLGLVIIALAYFFFDKMRRIIDTVGEGDPFVPENAERLTAMAWIMLGMQLLAVPAAGLALYIAKVFEDVDATVDAGFDLSGVIMVITLFILARVFRHGTAMRDDLEGTV